MTQAGLVEIVERLAQRRVRELAAAASCSGTGTGSGSGGSGGPPPPAPPRDPPGTRRRPGGAAPNGAGSDGAAALVVGERSPALGVAFTSMLGLVVLVYMVFIVIQDCRSLAGCAGPHGFYRDPGLQVFWPVVLVYMVFIVIQDPEETRPGPGRLGGQEAQAEDPTPISKRPSPEGFPEHCSIA